MAGAPDAEQAGDGYILLGLDPLYEEITTGVILLAAVGLDAWTRRSG